MPEDELDLAKRSHELYVEERKMLIDAARESARTFDKAILTFGSAAFGFSIAFLKDVVQHPAAQTRWLLIVSWVLFVASLGVILLSFLFSHKACISQIQCALKESTGEGSPRNPWALVTTSGNYTAIALLLGGIAFWIWFVCANLEPR